MAAYVCRYTPSVPGTFKKLATQPGGFCFSQSITARTRMKTKQEILKAIRVCARELGHSPSLRELRKLGGITEAAIAKHFGRLSKALEEAGLEVVGSGFEVAASALMLDWAAVARKLGK